MLDTKVLFSRNGKPYSAQTIGREVGSFGRSYNRIVLEIIKNSRGGITRQVFFRNVALLMPNFLMTRQGPFRGIRYIASKDTVRDPDGKIALCWAMIGQRLKDVKERIGTYENNSLKRVLIEMRHSERKTVSLALWEMFKKLLPVCMGKSTLGLVAASKILFSVLPEMALPVDNTQWRCVFKTVDYSDIIMHMAEEIELWERKTNQRLDSCVPEDLTDMTLPAIYNVMAMKARRIQ